MRLNPGTILDVQDDARGEVLRSVFPEPGLIPDSVKVALDLRSFPKLADEHFALVFTNGDQTFRKFAHPDPGHTILSTIYLLNTGHLLPKVAQQKAASELVKAAQLYKTPIPAALMKMALLKQVADWGKGKLLGGAMTAAMAAPAAMEAYSSAKNVLTSPNGHIIQGHGA
jgi:hypothetical protein